ncbi:hypothetical protein AAG570_010688 [Ranatra chinensis]|uniref:Ultrabithorax n=1 Tax=Ranatra chinensis TaxID=642074 RepID=A0ABD0YN90_9HEMI
MNSYFEQTGFYGSHHHQSGGAASHHHDQTAAAAAAAYRFPLGLGMSPYASSQHHHHHSMTRPPQDSPYDASVAAACKLYSASGESQSSVGYAAGKPDCSKTESGHQNGYAAVVAAAKDGSVWGGQTNSASANPLVRPAACTPDSRYPGLEPAASPVAATAAAATATAAASWNQCSINTAASQPAVATPIHQQPTNHTFYPWMAIAGWSPYHYQSPKQLVSTSHNTIGVLTALHRQLSLSNVIFTLRSAPFYRSPRSRIKTQ